MSKIYSKLRDFDAENEPKMGPHEQAVYDAICDKGPIERTDLVKELDERKESGRLTSDQDTSGLLSFHQRSLRLRGLIGVEVTPSESAGKARKTTLTVKVLKRIRDFNEEQEPKMGKAESLVYSLIPADGIRRPDLVAAIEAKVEAGEFETAQKIPGMVSFHQGNLTKRGLIAVESTEEPKPEAEAPTEDKPTKAKRKSKAA